MLETHSSNENGESIIKAFLTNQMSKAKREKFKMWWTAVEGPPHIQFVMMKENLESMQAVT